MSMTPNGHAAMQSRQPLQTSDWMTTVSYSVRMMAPVGQTSRQPACTQCLQTSLISSQRPPTRSSGNCSMNWTCRQFSPLSSRVLSYESPLRVKTSEESPFQFLQATSQALQPMQMVVSVKNPIGAAGNAPNGVSGEPAAGCKSAVCAATGVAWAGTA